MKLPFYFLDKWVKSKSIVKIYDSMYETYIKHPFLNSYGFCSNDREFGDYLGQDRVWTGSRDDVSSLSGKDEVLLFEGK